MLVDPLLGTRHMDGKLVLSSPVQASLLIQSANMPSVLAQAFFDHKGTLTFVAKFLAWWQETFVGFHFHGTQNAICYLVLERETFRYYNSIW